MSSLLLDAAEWDLVADASGNIAVADNPYALAQEVANAIRTFLGEVWFNTSLGLDYFGLVLGKTPSLALLKTALVAAALSIEGVASARCFIASFRNRVLDGQVQIVTTTGVTVVVPFSQVVIQ